LTLGLPGVAIGGLLAFIIVAWLRDGFVSREISPLVITVSVVTAVTALLLLASIAPAREAQHTQPASQLREE
jgi:ABC-type lipoprotein release transport system permease subunit